MVARTLENAFAFESILYKKLHDTDSTFHAWASPVTRNTHSHALIEYVVDNEILKVRQAI